MSKRWICLGIAIGAVLLVAASCSKADAPTSPSEVVTAAGAGGRTTGSVAGHMHAVSQSEDKGYIEGWLDGGDVRLYYTKSYYCAEPPSSSAPSNCEIGAPAETAPRPGPVPTIYAIAAAGFVPPSGTASCLAGTPCLNHPKMIDLSRIGGPPSASPASHSHILSAPGGGWFHTVNIRVFSPAAWNEIAQAKSLAKVRELQGNNPSVGTPGVISADTATNIYFFIAGARPD